MTHLEYPIPRVTSPQWRWRCWPFLARQSLFYDKCLVSTSECVSPLKKHLEHPASHPAMDLHRGDHDRRPERRNNSRAKNEERKDSRERSVRPLRHLGATCGADLWMIQGWQLGDLQGEDILPTSWIITGRSGSLVVVSTFFPTLGTLWTFRIQARTSSLAGLRSPE